MPRGIYKRTLEHNRKIGLANTKHGYSNTSTYSAWVHMKRRCFNHNEWNYKNYGGRGISICERWLDKQSGFLNFLKDMGMRPAGFSLDRIDNDGNYSKENCRWATQKEQAINKRRKIKIKKVS